MRLRTDEVIAPDMVGVLGTQPHAGPVVEPQPPSRLLLLWNLQPLTTPDPLDPVLAHLPASPLQQRRDPAIAIAAILAGQGNDGLGECVFVVALCRPVALRAAWLLAPPGTLVARSCHAPDAHGPPHNAVARGAGGGTRVPHETATATTSTYPWAYEKRRAGGLGLGRASSVYGRESSQIQFTSQVLPPSGENDCSIRADRGEMFSQT